MLHKWDITTDQVGSVKWDSMGVDSTVVFFPSLPYVALLGEDDDDAA
jgi:hypothetical protein